MRKAKFVLLLVAIATAGILIYGQGLKRLTPELAGLNVGQVATVCGFVVSTECDLPARTTFLNFDTPAGTPIFRVAITQTDRHRFGPRPEDLYHRRKLCVTGAIEAHRRGYRMIVNRPSQVVVESKRQPARVLPDSEVYRLCDEGMRPPQLIRSYAPQYTSDAMRAGIQGSVLLQGVVEIDGSVREVEVLRSLDPTGLDAEAVAAFQKWQFEPGTRFGQPVPVIITTEMAFTLRGR